MAFGGGIAPWALFDLGLDMFDHFFKHNIDFGTPPIVPTETSVRVSPYRPEAHRLEPPQSSFVLAHSAPINTISRRIGPVQFARDILLSGF